MWTKTPWGDKYKPTIPGKWKILLIVIKLPILTRKPNPPNSSQFKVNHALSSAATITIHHHSLQTITWRNELFIMTKTNHSRVFRLLIIHRNSKLQITRTVTTQHQPTNQSFITFHPRHSSHTTTTRYENTTRYDFSSFCFLILRWETKISYSILISNLQIVQNICQKIKTKQKISQCMKLRISNHIHEF